MAVSASGEHFSIGLRVRLEVANVALCCMSRHAPTPPPLPRTLCFLSQVLETNKCQRRRFEPNPNVSPPLGLSDLEC